MATSPAEQRGQDLQLAGSRWFVGLLAHVLAPPRDALVADCDRRRRTADHGLDVAVELPAERATKGITSDRGRPRFGFGSVSGAFIGHDRDATDEPFGCYSAELRAPGPQVSVRLC